MPTIDGGYIPISKLQFDEKEISAANEKKIRVEKNFFVKDALINFDVPGIDAALNSFVQGKVIPLRAVTSFTGFPPVEGYSWNLFLLESFLRRFSKKYSFMAAGANVNNSNIGAIFPKSWKIFGPPSTVLRWCCSVYKAAPQTLKIREILKKNNFIGAGYTVENFGEKQRGQYSHNYIYIFMHNLPINETYKK